MSDSVPLVRVLRGDRVESIHAGRFAIVGEDGTLLRSAGDVTQPVFYRSTSKPIQALVGITSGTADAIGLTPKEIALACGSHTGTPEHVAVALSILEKAGVPEAALGCGGHWSLEPKERPAQRMSYDEPPAVLNNCSGKHALMLATAKFLGVGIDGYLDPAHPVQVEIRRHVAALCGIEVERVYVAVDGCGAPTFAVPLDAAARSIAQIAAPRDLPEDLTEAATRIGDAMRGHPDMVHGSMRFDTDLMANTKAPLICKGGAEGFHGVGVRTPRLGIALKVLDGSDRGYKLVVLRLLEGLGVITAAEREAIAERQGDATLRNWAGTAVGRLDS